MPVDIVLYNGKVYTSRGLIEAGIAIDNGQITRIAKKTNLPTATSKMNLHENWVLPGLIDSHVHLRDEQLSYREDFESGTSAAAAGGFTTVIDMPNNRPLTMSVDTLTNRMRTAKPHIFVNVAFNSAFPTQINEIPRIVASGAVGFKLYLVQQIGGVNIDDNEAVSDAFKTVRKTQVPIAVHAEDKTTIEENRKKLQAQGKADLKAFLKAHTPEAETKAIRRVAKLAKDHKTNVHICHVSSAAGLDAVEAARKTGCNITCEVTPHHLLLTEQDLTKIGKLTLEIPPLRTPRDIDALWQALQNDFIDTIGSDHAPHTLDEKNAESIWDVKPGIVGLETMLPLLLTEVSRGRISFKKFIRSTCENPARIYHIRDRGKLQDGSPADITVVDPKKQSKIDAFKFYSKAKFSPFDGWKVKGIPVKTFVNGSLVMDEGEIVAKPGDGFIITAHAIKETENPSISDRPSSGFRAKDKARRRQDDD